MRAWGALGLLMATAFASAVGCGSNDSGDTTSTTGGNGGGVSSAGGQIGDACKTTSDCESGMAFFCSTDDPGGQCLKICKTTNDCPSGSVCTDEMKCYESCSAASDCTRMGYQCIDATLVTGKGTKTCDVPGAVGDACLVGSDCDESQHLFCSSDDPGGQCLAICKTQSDCPSGSVCTNEMKCYASCKSEADCTRGKPYACIDATTVDNKPTKTCDVSD